MLLTLNCLTGKREKKRDSNGEIKTAGENCPRMLVAHGLSPECLKQEIAFHS